MRTDQRQRFRPLSRVHCFKRRFPEAHRVSRCPGCATSPDSHAEISASLSLPSATHTDAPKPKPPIGAIAGGGSSCSALNFQQPGLSHWMLLLCFLGTVGGLVVLCLTGLVIITLLFRKQGGLKIPKIRKASGPVSLFDSEESLRSDPREGEAAAVKRPLLYVRSALLFSHSELLTWRASPGSYKPYNVLAGQRRAGETSTIRW